MARATAARSQFAAQLSARPICTPSSLNHDTGRPGTTHLAHVSYEGDGEIRRSILIEVVKETRREFSALPVRESVIFRGIDKWSRGTFRFTLGRKSGLAASRLSG